jgi:uncharacterized protein YlxP (DUF503 family)
MFLLVVEMVIHIPFSRSLKEKRGVKLPLVEGLRRSFGLAVAEVDRADAHQVLALGAAGVSGDAALLERMGGDVRSWVETHTDGTLAAYRAECLPWGRE